MQNSFIAFLRGIFLSPEHNVTAQLDTRIVGARADNTGVRQTVDLTTGAVIHCLCRNKHPWCIARHFSESDDMLTGAGGILMIDAGIHCMQYRKIVCVLIALTAETQFKDELEHIL